MIFSSLFKKKPTWQNQDSTMRITAISNDLQLNDTEHQDVLLSMVNNDDSDLVRRAALIKLHDFDVFVVASGTNSSEKVRSFAAKQIENILANQHEITLSATQKTQFLSQDDVSLPLLELCLLHEEDSGVVINLFDRINSRKNANVSSKKKSNSNQFLQSTFNQKQHEAVQTYLINQVSDVKLLEKLAKKACNSTVVALITTKLDDIHQLEQKPIVLAKKAQLILSKFLALKDNLDYGVYQNKKIDLDTEWQALQQSFDCLSSEQQDQLNDKYKNITQQLDKIFASQVEAFEQQKIAEKLYYDKQQAKVTFTQALYAQSQLLTTAVFENKTLDEDEFTSVLSALSENVSASVLTEKEKMSFIEQIAQLTMRLGQLGDIAESVSQATALISSISQLALPEHLHQLNERTQVYNQWLGDWRTIEKKTNGMLPKSIKAAQKDITSLWQAGLKDLQNEQKALFFKQKKKLNDIKRLTEQGKYKVCFGLFAGVKEIFPVLSSSHQQQLQRDFDSVNEKLADLSDWENYIATPRKKELLEEIKVLVTQPLDNPNEQAVKVKQFRQTWNSLGHADDEIDQQLNDEFNQACEAAFAPCRLFYAEQDKVRALHLATRENILEKAKQLLTQLGNDIGEGVGEVTDIKSGESNVQALNYKALDADLNKLQHEWQNAGEVDRQHYKKLQTEFREALQPVKEAISNYHLANVANKKALIAKAELTKENEDVFKAIEEIKLLQKAWREVGFAGSHHEAKLWKKFRVINDEVFAKRQIAKNEQQEEQSKQESALTERLASLQNAFATIKENDVDYNKVIKEIIQASQNLLDDIIGCKPVIKSIASQTENLLQQLEQKRVARIAVDKQKSWSTLFDLLTLIVNGKVDVLQVANTEQYLGLSKAWKKRLNEQFSLTEPADFNVRSEQTLALEVLAQVQSPAEYADQRMAIQVKLMQEKMLSGTASQTSDDELTKALFDWLMLGKLTKQELNLLARVSVIYCK